MLLDDKCNQTVGIFDVLYLCPHKKNGHKVYRIKCTVCGKEFEREYRHIKRTKICRHDCTAWNSNDKKLHKVYWAMVQRCYDTKSHDYKYYGGRGVKVCNSWLNNPQAFERWALKHGYRKGLTIDRINTNKGYNPRNCRWIDLRENARRAGKVNWIKIDGNRKTGRQWAEHFGLGVNYVNRQIRKYGLHVTKQLLTAMYFDKDVQEKIEKTRNGGNISLFQLYGIETQQRRKRNV